MAWNKVCGEDYWATALETLSSTFPLLLHPPFSYPVQEVGGGKGGAVEMMRHMEGHQSEIIVGLTDGPAQCQLYGAMV